MPLRDRRVRPADLFQAAGTAEPSARFGCRSSEGCHWMRWIWVVSSCEYAETSACAGCPPPRSTGVRPPQTHAAYGLPLIHSSGLQVSTLSEATGALSPVAGLDGWSGDSNVLARPVSAGGDAVESSALGRRKEGRGISSANGSNPDLPTASVLARAISSVSIAGGAGSSPSAHQSSRQCRFQAAAGCVSP